MTNILVQKFTASDAISKNLKEGGKRPRSAFRAHTIHTAYIHVDFNYFCETLTELCHQAGNTR